MRYKRLGNTGLKVSQLCLGCMTYTALPKPAESWLLDYDEAKPFFRTAIEGGINFFDTANVYGGGGSEMALGRAIEEMTRREEVVIATKVQGYIGTAPNDHGLSRKHILASVDRSLRSLRTDYIDLLQIHRFDYDTPIEETLAALDAVVRAGKVRYIGASSMYAWQFMKMLATSDRNGWARFVCLQPQYNLIYREEEREMLPLCAEERIGVIPWSPLARGFLAGGRSAGAEAVSARVRLDRKWNGIYYQEADFAVVDAIGAIAAARGVSNTQIALAWHAAKPIITAPIVGASKPHHLTEALASIDLELTPEEVAALEAPYQGKRVDHDYERETAAARDYAITLK